MWLLPCTVKGDDLAVQIVSTAGYAAYELSGFLWRCHASCRNLILQHLTFIRREMTVHGRIHCAKGYCIDRYAAWGELFAESF